MNFLRWENSFAMGLRGTDMKEAFVMNVFVDDRRHAFPTPPSGVNLAGGAALVLAEVAQVAFL